MKTVRHRTNAKCHIIYAGSEQRSAVVPKPAAADKKDAAELETGAGTYSKYWQKKIHGALLDRRWVLVRKG